MNLLPPELRQGSQAPLRTGPIPYIVVGALAAVLAGVALLVITGNQISERETEVTQLKQEDAAARREAKRLAPYTQFQSLHDARVSTITSLADSRFDWERVMRELSLILPQDVWLTEMFASASSESEAAENSGGALRASVPGPALVLTGCATGQQAVAGFVTALKDIDGVTRVGVELSELPGDSESPESTGGSSEEDAGAECRTRRFIAKFELVVAFDAAPVPVIAEGEGEEAATATEGAEAVSSETESSETSEGG